MRRAGAPAPALALALAFAPTLAAGACASRGSDGGPPLDAAAAPPVDAATAGDGFPPGAIGFFLGSLCPTGWTDHADATGRTIVPVASATEAGATVGAPLATSEPRTHRHELAVGVDLPSVSYAGIAGEANHGVARDGHVEGTTASDDATADLPYAQLRVCRKVATPGDRPPPRGVIAFFAGACPATWAPAPTALHGRVLIALPAGGTPGATFGGEPLAPGEVRGHGHPVSATLAAGTHGIALAGGCCAGGFGGAGDHPTTTTTVAAAVNLPYLQLLACVAP